MRNALSTPEPLILRDGGDYEHARAKRDQHLQMARTLQNEIDHGVNPDGIRGRIALDLAEADRWDAAMAVYDGLKRRKAKA